MGQLLTDDTYRGHSIMVTRKMQGGFKIVCTAMEESMEADTVVERDKKVQRCYGYIDGWKDAGGS